MSLFKLLRNYLWCCRGDIQNGIHVDVKQVDSTTTSIKLKPAQLHVNERFT